VAIRYTRDKLLTGAYHVYNRARDGMWLFRDDEDRRYFEYLVDRHISSVPRFDRYHRPYVWLRSEVTMHARNLLYTHFHLILLQLVPGGMDRLMTTVLSIYSRYYNAKYGTTGYLFEGEYRARRIDSPSLYRWCVGYVHDNHDKEGVDWEFSTHRYFADPDEAPDSLVVASALKQFGGRDPYLDYMEKRSRRQDLDAELRFGR
jgi:hypothetical protein